MPLRDKNNTIPVLIGAALAFLGIKFWKKAKGSQSQKNTVRRKQVPYPTHEQESGTFSTLSYNIAGLPGVVSQAVTKRGTSIALIGRLINGYDLVNIQEDFHYHRQLYHGGNKHPFRTATKGPTLFGDGLNTLSLFPLYQLRRMPWANCTKSNCLTPKGFSYCRVGLAKDVFIDLYNVHANAYEDAQSAYARRLNIIQLYNYVKKHSEGQAVLIMGDMNSNYSDPRDNVKFLVKKAGLKDVWIELMNSQKLPEIIRNLRYLPKLHVTDLSESIDKVFYRSSSRITLSPKNYRIEGQLFTNKDKLPLSDHLPVAVDFEWKLVH